MTDNNMTANNESEKKENNQAEYKENKKPKKFAGHAFGVKNARVVPKETLNQGGLLGPDHYNPLPSGSDPSKEIFFGNSQPINPNIVVSPAAGTIPNLENSVTITASDGVERIIYYEETAEFTDVDIEKLKKISSINLNSRAITISGNSGIVGEWVTTYSTPEDWNYNVTFSTASATQYTGNTNRFSLPDHFYNHVKGYKNLSIAGLYTDIRKVWDRDQPMYITGADAMPEEIVGHMNIHPDIRLAISNQYSGNTAKRKKMITSLVESFGARSRSVGNMNPLDHYPSPELFDAVVRIQNMAADIDPNDPKRADLIAAFNNMINDVVGSEGFIYNSDLKKHEENIGLAVIAHNIMCLAENPGNRELTSNYSYNTVIIDYDVLHYPWQYSRRLGSPTTQTTEAMSNAYFAMSAIAHGIVDKIETILYRANVSIKLAYPLNIEEWAEDFVRYMSEMDDYIRNPNKYIDKVIYEPLPLRLAIKYQYAHALNLISGRMPSEAINLLYSASQESKDKLTDSLWRGIYNMTIIRNLEHRHEFSPQIWDVGYYMSTLEPKFDGVQLQDPKNKEISIRERESFHEKIIYCMSDRTVQAGTLTNLGEAPKPIIARKFKRAKADEIGWYYGFAEP